MKFFKTAILLASASVADASLRDFQNSFQVKVATAKDTTTPKREVKFEDIPKLVQVVDGVVEGYTGEELSTDYTICIADAIEASADLVDAVDMFESDESSTQKALQ